MIVRLFKSNQPAAIILLPIIAIIFWAKAIIWPSPLLSDNGYSMVFYDFILTLIQGNTYTAAAIALSGIVGGAFLLNYIINEHEIMEKRSYMIGLIYVVWMSCLTSIQLLHPIIWVNICMMIGINHLLNSYRKTTAFAEVFEAGLWAGIASLFYFPALVFILFVWISILILRPFVWREWILALIGLVLPFIFTFIFYFLTDHLFEFVDEKIRLSFSVSSFSSKLSMPSYIVISILGFLVLNSLASVFSLIGTKKQKSKNTLILLLWIVVLSIFMLFFCAPLSLFHFSIMAIPFSVFICHYFIYTKKERWSGILFFILVVAIFYQQLF